MSMRAYYEQNPNFDAPEPTRGHTVGARVAIKCNAVSKLKKPGVSKIAVLDFEGIQFAYREKASIICREL